jgi:hypothetical protein
VKVLDPYERRARLYPAALAAAPAIVLLGVGAAKPAATGSLAAIVIGALSVLVCAVVRDAGADVQARLFEQWGGSPTVRALRWAGNDAKTIADLHRRVAKASDVELPSAKEEQNDPADADRRYEEAVGALRELTREAKKYPLVFKENVDYGFRRNCLGIRRLAMVVALLVAVAGLALLLLARDDGATGRYWIATGVGVTAAGLWWRIVRPDWVRRAADRYARQLLVARWS